MPDAWISVKDRLPEEGVEVSGFRDTSEGKMFYTVVHVGKGKWTRGGYSISRITHWRPLPDPPKEWE